MTLHSNSERIDLDEIFGLTEKHLVSIEGSQLLIHKAAYQPFIDMRSAAREEGIEICIASAYRSFARQLLIWNNKAIGKRPCLDDSGNEIDLSALNELEAVICIMRYSALPGLSRHHWGTELDIYDSNAIAEDYALQLIPVEYKQEGPFYPLHSWLTKYAQDFGFDRPYEKDRGGIAPEAWHISYKSIAQQYATSLERDLNLEKYRQLISHSDIELKQIVINNLQYLFERFVQIA